MTCRGTASSCGQPLHRPTSEPCRSKLHLNDSKSIARYPFRSAQCRPAFSTYFAPWLIGTVGLNGSAFWILGAIGLVNNLVKALHDCNGSSREYRKLIHELHGLETALLEVKALDLEVEQRAKRVALRQAASQCQASIDHFLGGLQVPVALTIGWIVKKLEGYLPEVSMASLQER